MAATDREKLIAYLANQKFGGVKKQPFPRLLGETDDSGAIDRHQKWLNLLQTNTTKALDDATISKDTKFRGKVVDILDKVNSQSDLKFFVDVISLVNPQATFRDPKTKKDPIVTDPIRY